MYYSGRFLQIVVPFLFWSGSYFKDVKGDEFEDRLVDRMKVDDNLDLSVDEEYEDLRAELLAYHTALNKLSSSRRSLISTPCWEQGGICVNHNLCPPYNFQTEVRGCRDKLQVCCFTWNKRNVKDFTHHGINNLAYPWKIYYEFGGEGIKAKEKVKKKKKKRQQPKNNTDLDMLRILLYH